MAKQNKSHVFDDTVKQFANTDIPKRSTTQLTLPSNGWFYNKNNNNEFITSLNIANLRGADEDKITSGSNGDLEVIFRNMYNITVEEKDIIPYDELLFVDKFAFKLHSRIHTFGSMYDCKVLDPYLKKYINTSVDLSNIAIYPISEKPSDNGYYDFTLPDSKRKLLLKPMSDSLRNNITSNPNNGDIIDRLTYSIVSIDGDTDKTNIVRFLSSIDFTMKDSFSVRKFINKIEPVPDISFTFKSKKDNLEYVQDIPIDKTFFFPSYGL